MSRPGRSRRVVETALGVVLLAIALVLAVTSSGRAVPSPLPHPQPSPTPTPTVSLTQSTLLIGVLGSDSVGAADVLTSVGGPTDRAAWITVDPRLEVEVPGSGTATLGTAGTGGTAAATTGTALSDVAGVRIDGTWLLGRLTLAGLVDAVGGVTIYVPAPVVLAPGAGAARIVVPAGSTHMEGETAAIYATASGPGQTQADRTRRASDVLTQVVMSLPVEPERIRPIVVSLGAFSNLTLTPDALAGYLAHLRSDLVAGDVDRAGLPTSVVVTSKPPAIVLQRALAGTLIARLLPTAVRTPGPSSPVRVLVQMAVGTPDLAHGIADKLAAAGLAYVNGRDATGLGLNQSQILVPDSTEQSMGWGYEVASALGLPAWDVRAVGRQIVGGDVQAIIGSDYHP